jgi:amino acid transporter
MRSGAQMTAQEPSTLRRELGFAQLVVFGIVYMAPISAFTLFGWVTTASDGAAVPAYIIGALAVALTAASYGMMGEVVPLAGSTYSYARSALGPLTGFIAGWAVILDYLLIGALVALYAGLFLNATVPQVPTEVWIAGFLLFSLLTNLMGIRWSMGAEIAIAVVQLLFIVVFVLFATELIWSQTVTLPAAWPTGVSVGQVASGSAFAVISYLGFDAVMTLTEEVRSDNPGRTAGRAALVCIAIMMTIFVGITWLLSAVGQGIAIDDPAQAALMTFSSRLPMLVWPFTLVAALALGLGGTVAIHAGVSRIVFGMARDNQLPAVLAKVNGRTQVPWVAVLTTQAIMAAGAYLALPQVDLLASMVSFGALIAFILVNASVIGHFGYRRRSQDVIRHWLLPSLGIVVLAYVLSNIQRLAVELGIAWLVLGVVYFLTFGRSLTAKAIGRSP